MRISIYTNTIYPVPGGLQRYTYYLAESLAHEGHQVVVYTTIHQEFGNAAIPFSCQVLAPKNGTEGLWAKMQLFARLLSSLKQQKPELVICTWWEPMGYLLALQKLLRGHSYLLIGHGQEILNSNGNQLLLLIKNQLRKYSFRLASKSAGVSRYSSNLILKLGVLSSKLILLPNGLNQAFIEKALKAPFALPKALHDLEGYFIFQPGRIEPRKGHIRILEVLHELEKNLQKPVYFVISGTGPYEKFLRSEIVRRDLENRVFMLGYLSEESLHACYQRADIITTLSFNEENPDDVEGFGIVYLEAYAHKKVVIAYPYGGVQEAVVNGETGFLVEHGRPDQLLEKAKLLLADPELRNKMGEQAHQWLLKNAFWPNIVKRLF